jgi:mono/diheme cytochrome c family protein
LHGRLSPATAGLLLFAALVFALLGRPAVAQGDPKRGEYLAKAGGCVGCHTEDRPGAIPFAGGRALKTPFGTFFGPNITPDPQAGLGRWSEADFMRAMREGRRPDGAHYYPAFPYISFTKIVDSDLKDLWAYLRSLAPSARPSTPHDLRFPFNFRFLLWIWKWLFFDPGPFVPDPARSATLNRGAYLTDALGHCGECHTPRNVFGASKSGRHLAGGPLPGGDTAPNLTPTRLKKWNDSDLRDFLQSGATPDGDVVAEAMGEVITNTTSKLAPQDLDALMAYLRSLPPLPEEAKPK